MMAWIDSGCVGRSSKNLFNNKYKEFVLVELLRDLIFQGSFKVFNF